MATISDWLEGARIRTLPAAVSPVILGGAIAFNNGGFSWIRTLLAAVVALALQIGVNFSNDYSDGIRGTDDVRTGPPRLTGGGKARPRIVLGVACGFFALACIAGLILVILSAKWWIVGVGIAAVLAAWFYTGGKQPYGYMGLGEVFVLVFFGWVATVGTVYLQTGTAPWEAWLAATGVGLIACALLMINNIRDIPTDSRTGKRTLAVRLGDSLARKVFLAMIAIPLLIAAVFFFTGWHFALVAFGACVGIVSFIAKPVLGGAKAIALISVLKSTGQYELMYAILLGLAFVIE